MEVPVKVTSILELERYLVWLETHEGTLDDYRSWVVDTTPTDSGGTA